MARKARVVKVNITDKVREQGRERQRTYRAKNKDKINEKKRSERAELKRRRLEDDDREALAAAQPVGRQVVIRRPKANRPPVVYTLPTLLVAIGTLEKEPSSIRTYCSLARTLYRVTNSPPETSFKRLLELPTTVEHIKNSHTIGGKKSPTNTVKQYFQGGLFLNDSLHVGISDAVKTELLRQFDICKIDSKDQGKKRTEANEKAVYSYPVYMDKVLAKYGEASKEYLIVKLYGEVPCRDNLILKIVPSEGDDKRVNYLVMPRGGTVTIVLNEYKTKTKYLTNRTQLSAELSALVASYIKTQKIKTNQFLFGASGSLSSTVSAMNIAIGVTDGGGINYIRHSIISTLYATNPSASARQALAKRMMHSPAAQEGYVREIRVDKAPRRVKAKV
jgi:hypothetical protein